MGAAAILSLIGTLIGAGASIGGAINQSNIARANMANQNRLNNLQNTQIAMQNEEQAGLNTSDRNEYMNKFTTDTTSTLRCGGSRKKARNGAEQFFDRLDTYRMLSRNSR